MDEEYPILDFLHILLETEDNNTIILRFPETLRAPNLRQLTLQGFALPMGSRLMNLPKVLSYALVRVKLSPLADWTWGDVWHYLRERDVPYNALHDRFFPSIGCAPCTRAVALGEDFRAGRWWWEQDGAKECGLHVAPAASALAPMTP